MPDPGATDPADLQAEAPAQLGLLSRQLKQMHHVTPRPSLGGGQGFNIWFHEEQLAKTQAGDDVDVSERSLCCWGERLHPDDADFGDCNLPSCCLH